MDFVKFETEIKTNKIIETESSCFLNKNENVFIKNIFFMLFII